MPDATPRIPPLPPAEWTEEVRDFFAIMEGPEGREKGSRYNIILTFAHYPLMAGAFNTPMALTDSQKIPSAVEALPMLAHATSSPFFENCVNCFNSGRPRYSTEAYARPTVRGICVPVGETSAAVL